MNGWIEIKNRWMDGWMDNIYIYIYLDGWLVGGRIETKNYGWMDIYI